MLETPACIPYCDCMATLKEQALVSIQKLPENASAEDIIDSILLTEKVNAAISELDAGKGITHADVVKTVATWPAK